jgi:CHAT domain-containing protein
VNETTLKAATARTRSSGKPLDPPSEAFNELYAWLIAPLKSSLTTRRIGIIPHSVLHYLPFAALTDGQRYFGEAYVLFSLPSASVLQFVHQTQHTADDRILALAGSQTEPPLYYAEREVKTISRHRNAHTLMGEQATESAFKHLAAQFPILQLAAHGELNTRNPFFSRVLLSSDEENDGALHVYEIYELDLSQADLVVLSACDTQLGKQSRGDDIIGLTRAFIYAGTPSVIASLWKVDDRATSDFMTAFYQQLRRGKSKAAALQTARMQTREKYPHPYYWAAFVLTGDPGTSSVQIPWVPILVIGGVIVAALLLRLGFK